MSRSRTVLLGILVAALLSACSLLAGPDDEQDEAAGRRFDPAVSLTDAGAALAASAGTEVSTALRGDGHGRSATGSVRGTVVADLPIGADSDIVHLRYFAGLPDFDAGARLGDVTVDGTRRGPGSTPRSSPCRCRTATGSASRWRFRSPTPSA